jgi:citrate synthase
MTDKVLPNTQFDSGNLPQMLTYLKQQKKWVNGKVTLDKAVKTEIANLVATYPHPMAVLQKMVQALKEGKGTVVTMAQEQAQKSRFVAGMTAQQTAQARMAEISKAMQSEAAPIPESTVPAIDLKALKKKRPPTGRI